MGEQPTGDSWVGPIAEGMGTMPLGVIKCDGLFQRGACRQELSNPQPGAPLPMMRFYEQGWVLGLLRDDEQLLVKFSYRFEN